MRSAKKKAARYFPNAPPPPPPPPPREHPRGGGGGPLVSRQRSKKKRKRKKHLKILGYTPTRLGYSPISIDIALNFTFLHLLPFPPSFLCLRCPGFGSGALPRARFRVRVPGRPVVGQVRSCCWWASGSFAPLACGGRLYVSVGVRPAAVMHVSGLSSTVNEERSRTALTARAASGPRKINDCVRISHSCH